MQRVLANTVFWVAVCLLSAFTCTRPYSDIAQDGKNIVIRNPHFTLTLSPDLKFTLNNIATPNSPAAHGIWLRASLAPSISPALKISRVEKVLVINDPKMGPSRTLPVSIATIERPEKTLMQVEIILWERFPDIILTRAKLTAPEKWKPSELVLLETRIPAVTRDSILVWSFQGASYEARPNWVLPVRQNYARENFLGMNASDYGGGIPVVDLWRQDYGVALGHAETLPVRLFLPVRAFADSMAEMAIKWQPGTKPWETHSPLVFLLWHEGDYYEALQKYAGILRQRGWNPAPSPAAAFEPQWCAWGYERHFKPEEIVQTLPKVKELGYKWAVLDDGWQVAEGEWRPESKKFPRGEADLKAFVNQIHDQGLKAGVWWAPMCADPGSEVAAEHPDWFLLDQDGKRRLVTWWDADYLCPALPEVVAYHQQVVRTLLQTYGFDGLKIDGQHLNAAPPCYNPTHAHAYPEIASEKVPELFAAIQQEALSINPEAVLQLCPCGDTFSAFNLPYYNQTVASDPVGSFQIRLKAKTQKALLGNSRAYYGDHVELSDGGNDFASTVALGGVIGTKFTWPAGPDPAIRLTPARENEWRKWSAIYYRENLPRGEYLNLYDIGYDRPEGHVIARDDTLWYAFFAASFSGALALRGLDRKRYKIENYETGADLGAFSGPKIDVNVDFARHVLLKAIPVQQID